MSDDMDFLMGEFEQWAEKERLLTPLDVTDTPPRYIDRLTKIYFKAFCAGMAAQKAQPPCGADGAVPDELAADVAALGVSLAVGGYRNDAELLYKAAEKLRLLSAQPAAPVAQNPVQFGCLPDCQKCAAKVLHAAPVAPATVAVPDDELEVSKQAATDARRYRFLRSEEPISNGRPFIARSIGGALSMWTGRIADEEVDAALQSAGADGAS